MKNRKTALIVGIVILLLAVLWWRLKYPERSHGTKAVASSVVSRLSTSPTSTSKSPSTSPRKSDATLREEAIAKVQAVFETPITFYGKVIDQNGDSVPDANVDYSAVDKFFGNATKYHGRSDENGMFSISGIKGAELTNEATKAGAMPLLTLEMNAR